MNDGGQTLIRARFASNQREMLLPIFLGLVRQYRQQLSYRVLHALRTATTNRILTIRNQTTRPYHAAHSAQKLGRFFAAIVRQQNPRAIPFRNAVVDKVVGYSENDNLEAGKEYIAARQRP